MLYSVYSVRFSACFLSGVAGGIVSARVRVLAARARENAKASPPHSPQGFPAPPPNDPAATQATEFYNWLLWLLVRSISVSWYVIVSGGF